MEQAAPGGRECPTPASGSRETRLWSSLSGVEGRLLWKRLRGVQEVSGYRRDIDGLRAVAIGSVLIFHAFPKALVGGFTGVDVFFVISGYLISGLLQEEAEAGRFSIVGFYVRRIRRLLPALMLVVPATLAFGCWVLTPNEFQLLTKHVAASSAFVSNIVYGTEAGYFDVSASLKPLVHLWSLGVEEQFYIVWPLLILVLARWSGRVPVLAAIGLILAASFLFCLIETGRDAGFAFYFPLSRFWELAAGAALAAWERRGRAPGPRTADLLSVIGLALMALGFLTVTADEGFPGWGGLPPVVGAALVIAAGPGAVGNRRLLSSGPMVWLGLISYPLYLWHWPLLSFLHITFPRDENLPSLPAAGLVVVSIGLAWATWRFVERPVRAGSRPPAYVGRLLAANGVMLALGGALWLGDVQPRLSGGIVGEAVAALRDDEYPPVGARVERVAGETAYHFGPVDAPKVLFIGDSTMEHFAPRIARLAAERGLGGADPVFITRGGCRPVPNLTKLRRRDCLDFVGTVYRYAVRPEVTAVVIGGGWYPGLEDPDLYHIGADGRRASLSDPAARAAVLADLETAMARLTRSGRRVFFVHSVPGGDADVEVLKSIPPLVRLGLADLSAAPAFLPMEKLVNPRTRELLTAIAVRTGATVIDPVATMCADGRNCRLVGPDGHIVYRDAMHLAAGYVRDYATFMDVAMTPAAPGPGRR